jgi:C-terminal processing protease CtpA/Prc
MRHLVCDTCVTPRRALTDLKAQGAKAFVMDVRNNGGGLFPAGVKISKMFYDKGTIVYIADDAGNIYY